MKKRRMHAAVAGLAAAVFVVVHAGVNVDGSV